MEFLQSALAAWGTPALALATLALAAVVSGHAILNKSDTRAAVAWVGVIWLAPVVGSILYLLLGVNRIQRRATLLRHGMERVQGEQDLAAFAPGSLDRFVPAALQPLSRLSNRVARQPLLGGNRLGVLRNGDEAYPAMLASIESASTSISLSTYIFNNDSVGKQFAEALGRARDRGVDIRVLVDAVGLRYTLPTIEGVLRRRGIPHSRFLPPRLPWNLPFMNLRNHRKLMVVDGRQGYVGGMNIAEGNCLQRHPRHPIQDLHFSVEGPVVSELQAVFAEDWAFSAGEALRGARWFPPPERPGASLARVIADGPDERYDTLRQVMSGAIAVAKSRVRVMTPYFLPDATLRDALCTAALRGVEVDIILPARNNLPIVAWACEPQLGSLLRWGVRIWYSPPPFDHSKLLTVDDAWALVGSANWDPRSLSLNFECNVECYDEWLLRDLNQGFDSRLATCHEITSGMLSARSLPVRLRNGVARLFTPYL
ncbi:cardiolipin synthase [Natronospira bacteriovora]|uniref:Cardiolipin synthase n=1 Tax=Natronospira bacteriovora TaxID=3069753 RepID=A0ABU0W5E8_9GAMM|nr:cardiolipin synthase [Natronospira sp. AB-CW4]MDQ2069234.1 cardiolipin synthase [Natronospira sp. AB-CW4]